MSETHISYKVSKRLKEFLGDSTPNAIDGRAYITEQVYGKTGVMTNIPTSFNTVPAYALHDLLSKPFCFAMADKMEGENSEMINPYRDIHGVLSESYFVGGLPAVEAALMEMMK